MYIRRGFVSSSQILPPQGQWYCVHCHNNPTLRHPKDKLATMKTSVSKYGNLKLHENSARHKAVMDAIEQKNATRDNPESD